MNNETIDFIIECMASNIEMSDIQRVQTEHRFKLAEFWNIKEGKRVLEIGCGQGDTTAVLAYFVGEKGLVHGIDIGSPDYGSPISLGDSAKFLKKSKVGKQIKIEFEMNLLSPNVEFPENFFDYIILSHCSWYLKSIEEFNEVLKKVRKWGKKLCFAEWDTRLNSIEQYPHLLSILIQAQYESFKQKSDSNVRTLFTPSDIKLIAESAGWNIMSEKTIFSPDLQDGKWEVNKVLTDLDVELSEISNMPQKLKRLIQSEVTMLEDFINNSEIKPLSVFAFVAE
ncbi:class I SAM-dependent methyltransferase [Bacillus sp. RG28]|uniref:Class I SAM-dependent methyltransferase n=1 Tax=Gottfriedia endophytica TaxID=2820819 RepID=A0A940NNN2_9BACI|nr:class I SAM-dependent methyltransferase [Gottfriedia endophytica]MBP0725489.1 class I SAM-dependent methyltransferase [Gottfriedia endophytica]